MIHLERLMYYNVCKVDREGEGVGRRDENSAEAPRLINLKAEHYSASLFPLLVPFMETPPVQRGRPAPWRSS